MDTVMVALLMMARMKIFHLPVIMCMRQQQHFATVQIPATLFAELGQMVSTGQAHKRKCDMTPSLVTAIAERQPVYYLRVQFQIRDSALT